MANDARGPATWPSWAFPWTEGAATSTLGTSRWIAQASSSVMDTLLPVPRRTPPEVTVPARTIIRFEPRLWISSATRAWAPAPTPTMVMTPPLEVLLLFLEALDLGAQPSEFDAERVVARQPFLSPVRDRPVSASPPW